MNQKSKMAAGLLGIFLGAWGVHQFYLGDTKKGIIRIVVSLVTCGIGGIWGGIATGIFAKSSINPVAQWDGLAFGDFHLFGVQIVGILVTIVVSIVGTLICVGIVRLFTKLRVEDHDEKVGLDATEHGESAYPSFNGLD